MTKLVHNIFCKFSNTLDKNAHYFIKLNIDRLRVISFYRKMYEINYNNQIGLGDMCVIRSVPKTWEYFWIITFFPPIFMKTSRFLFT